MYSKEHDRLRDAERSGCFSSDVSDTERDYFRDFNPFYGQRAKRAHPTCVHCGSTKVAWRRVDEGWRLFNTKRSAPGNRKTRHDCRHVPATASDFEVV